MKLLPTALHTTPQYFSALTDLPMCCTKSQSSPQVSSHQNSTPMFSWLYLAPSTEIHSVIAANKSLADKMCMFAYMKMAVCSLQGLFFIFILFFAQSIFRLRFCLKKGGYHIKYWKFNDDNFFQYSTWLLCQRITQHLLLHSWSECFCDSNSLSKYGNHNCMDCYYILSLRQKSSGNIITIKKYHTFNYT